MIIPSQQEKIKLAIKSLKNAVYYVGLSDEPIKLKDGSFLLVEEDKNGMANCLKVDLLDDKIAMGDVDGDGDEDAVVVLVSSGCGSGAFHELVVMSNDKGKPKYLTGHMLGDRIIVNFIKILPDRSILIDMVVHGPNDGMCCPTVPKVGIYRVVGKKIEVVN